MKTEKHNTKMHWPKEGQRDFHIWKSKETQTLNFVRNEKLNKENI